MGETDHRREEKERRADQDEKSEFTDYRKFTVETATSFKTVK